MSFIYRQLGDYRRGAMGDVRQLPAALLDALRTADVAQREWQDELEVGDQEQTP